METNYLSVPNPTARLTPEELNKFMLRVMTAVAKHEVRDDLWWRTDDDRGGKINGVEYGGKDYSPITFLVNCNDTFYWGSADCEELTPENIDLFEQTLAEVAALPEEEQKFPILYAADLFVARVRKMRPQGACYERRYPKVMHPLFDACGEEREVGFGNPKGRG